MEIWSWESFLAEFSLPVLVASILMAGLGMVAQWSWRRHRQIIFWGVVWLMTFLAIGLVLAALQSQGPTESTRPYFTKVQSKIYQVTTTSGGKHPLTVLTVGVQNNEVPARNVVSQLMIFDRRLDPTSPPLRTQRFASANDIGRFQNHAQHTPVSVGRNTKAAIVVFEVKYDDTLSGQAYSQIWFMKFGGSTRVGNFVPDLFDADQHERTKIESYIRQQGIPMLRAEVPR